MWLFGFGCWVFGLLVAAVVGELARSETRWVLALAKASFVLSVAVQLGVITVLVAASPADSVVTRGGLWRYALGAAIPVTIVGLARTRRALTRLWVAAIGVLPVFGYLLASVAARTPPGASPVGFEATAHHHHLLVVAALLFALTCAAASVTAAGRGWTERPYDLD